MAQFETVPEVKVFEVVRQALLGRHRGPLQQHRCDRNVSFERRCNFLTHEVGGIVQPPPYAGVLGVKPAWAYERQQRLARFESLVETLAKIAPERDAVDV